MPYRNPHRKKGYRILCFKCGEYGYVGVGWTQNKYRRHRAQYQVCYVRHYSPEVYRKQMERYRNHEIKAKPNGQKRCYIQSKSFVPVANGEYWAVCCALRPGSHKLEKLY